MENDFWENRYRRLDTPWDRGSAAPPLRDWIDKYGPLAGRVLVPGCGYGHDVRLLAEHASPEDQIIGLDLAQTALERARQHPVVSTERYVQGDLFDPPADWQGAFDWVFEHTCFCAIDPAARDAYVQSVSNLLRSDGRLLAIFYLRPYDPGEQIPPGPPYGVSEAELDVLFRGKFSLSTEYVPSMAYAGREGRELVRCLRRRE